MSSQLVIVNHFHGIKRTVPVIREELFIDRFCDIRQVKGFRLDHNPGRTLHRCPIAIFRKQAVDVVCDIPTFRDSRHIQIWVLDLLCIVRGHGRSVMGNCIDIVDRMLRAIILYGIADLCCPCPPADHDRRPFRGSHGRIGQLCFIMGDTVIPNAFRAGDTDRGVFRDIREMDDISLIRVRTGDGIGSPPVLAV